MQYKAAYIKYTQTFLDKEPRADGLTAEKIVNSNIGYYAGYGSNEDRERIEGLFECSHPVFGSAKFGIPTAEEAFECGKQVKTLSEIR
jgi:hypothetical protein